MSSKSSPFILASALLAIAAPALAGSPPPADVPRAFVVGAAGSAVGHTNDGVVSAAVGATVVPHLQISGEFGRLTNIMPSATTTALNDVAASFGDPGDVTYNAKMPANYWSGTARVTGGTYRHVTPFAQGGAGFARVSADVSAIDAGTDVSPAFLAVTGLTASVTKPLLTVGGGVSFGMSRRSAIDVGYRYDRIFTDTAIATNRVVASLRLAF